LATTVLPFLNGGSAAPSWANQVKQELKQELKQEA
jgi:hypothetical protein